MDPRGGPGAEAAGAEADGPKGGSPGPRGVAEGAGAKGGEPWTLGGAQAEALENPAASAGAGAGPRPGEGGTTERETGSGWLSAWQQAYRFTPPMQGLRVAVWGANGLA